MSSVQFSALRASSRASQQSTLWALALDGPPRFYNSRRKPSERRRAQPRGGSHRQFRGLRHKPREKMAAVECIAPTLLQNLVPRPEKPATCSLLR